jgi:hypothetical protein
MADIGLLTAIGSDYVVPGTDMSTVKNYIVAINPNNLDLLVGGLVSLGRDLNELEE